MRNRPFISQVSRTVAVISLTMASAHAATIIESNQDTYIWSGEKASTPHNGDTYMMANDNGSDVQMTVFSFDLSTHTDSITSAKLELTDKVGNNSSTFEVYGLLDTAETFDEVTLTWDNTGFLTGSTIDLTKVYGGAALGTFANVNNTTNVVFDVTSGLFLDFLKASGDNDVTFVIVDPNSAVGGSGWAVHEDGTAAIRPTLTLTGTEVLLTELLHHNYDSDFTDESTSNNDGTASGNAAITSDNSSVATGMGALGLDGGSSSFVDLDTAITFTATDSWSTTWWARRSYPGGDQGMVMGDKSDTDDFIWLNNNYTGLRFRSSDNTTHDFTLAQDSTLHHYALIADGAGNLSLYRDGVWLEDKTGDTSFTINTIGKAYNNNNSYNFSGSLDEVRVFGGALNATQVNEIYNEEKPEADTTDPLVTRLRIILLGGQSNGDGRASTSELPTNLQSPQEDVDFFYRVEGGIATLTKLTPGLSETSGFGPAITLGRKMADLLAGETNTRVAIIKYANGGTTLHTSWKAGGDNTITGDGVDYVLFQQTVSPGLTALADAYPNATLDLQGMVWMQGESDATTHANATNYQANLTTFIADIRSTFGVDLPFIIGRLSSGQTGSGSYLTELRASQDAVAAADPRTGIIDTDAFELKGDNLHFTGNGQQSMGEAFAREIAYHQWMRSAFTSGEIDARQAEPDGDADNDGKSNSDEFLGDSDPQDATSSFKAWITIPTKSTVMINYAASIYRKYAVDKLEISSSTWLELLPYERGEGVEANRALLFEAPSKILRVRSDLP